MPKTKVVQTKDSEESKELKNLHDKNIIICLLIGLPGCGKSTLSKIICSELETDFVFTVVTMDDWLPANSNLEYISWKKHRLQAVQFCRSQLESFLQHSPKGSCVHEKKQVLLVDDNMFYRSMRYDFYQMARNLQISFSQIYLDTRQDICISRIATRLESSVDHVTLESFQKMAGVFEVPRTESKWESNSFTIKDNAVDLPSIARFLEQTAENSVPALFVRSRTANTASVKSFVHQADLSLRATVKGYLTNTSSCATGRELANVKRILLRFLSHGEDAGLCMNANEILDRIDTSAPWQDEPYAAIIAEAFTIQAKFLTDTLD